MNEKTVCKKYDWKDEYNVGVESLDIQHRKFLENLNKMADIINKGKCKERISELFFSLGHFAENYFTQEEMLFKEYQYPNFSKHKEAHNAFIEEVIKLKEEFSNNSTTVCKNIYLFLENWFNNHILQYDKEAVTFLKEKGV